MGLVPRDCVEILNELIAHRAAREDRRLATSTPGVEGPRCSARALAASQGRDVPGPRGVQHTVSAAKQVRGKARLMEKRLEAEHREWLKGARVDLDMWHDQQARRRIVRKNFDKLTR